MWDLCLDLRLFTLARDLFSTELDGFQSHFLVTDQVVHRDRKGIGQRNEDS